MEIVKIFIIGIALSMDAFGVSLAIGVSAIKKRKEKLKAILSFSGFQLALSFLGAICGYYFDEYIANVPIIFGGIIIGIVGILMIMDGNSKESRIDFKNDFIMILLGISVSIDAFVIGFTAMHTVSDFVVLFLYSLIIGLITLLFCTFAFFIVSKIKDICFINKYANYFGGITLILLAIKMMFS